MHELSVIRFVALSLAVSFAMPNAATVIESRDLVKKSSLFYYHDVPFSGIAIEHWLNGKIFQQSRYVKGLPEGRSVKFALNGRLVERLHFHAGKKDGLQEGWFEEGPKKFQYRYKNGVLDGPQTEWRMNGKVFRDRVFIAGREVEKKNSPLKRR